jgi:hypothetical protein
MRLKRKLTISESVISVFFLPISILATNNLVWVLGTSEGQGYYRKTTCKLIKFSLFLSIIACKSLATETFSPG